MTPRLPPWLTPCQRAVFQATAHLSTRTLADASAAECQACMAHPEVRRLEARIEALIAKEDVLAVQQAYQALAKVYKAALAALRTEEHAA
jgi:hypothetical protein